MKQRIFVHLEVPSKEFREKAVLWAKYQGSDLSKLIREFLTVELKKAGMIKNDIPVIEEQANTEEKFKYDAYAEFTASRYLGTIEAKNKEEAEDIASEKFEEQCYVSLCHSCAKDIDSIDFLKFDFEKLEDEK